MSLQGIIYTLKTMVGPYLEKLKAYNFTFNNPLFWIFALFLFLVMTRFWQVKKSFSFSLLVCAILLLTTKLEGIIATWLTSVGESFDPLAIRVIAFFALLMVFFYYSLIRE